MYKKPLFNYYIHQMCPHSHKPNAHKKSLLVKISRINSQMDDQPTKEKHDKNMLGMVVLKTIMMK